MDSLTHLVLGAAIGEVVLGKKIGRKAMLWGAFANTIPDFDVFGACCNSHAEQLMFHRGFTHSILFVVLMSAILGWLFNRFYKKAAVGWRKWSLLFFLGLFTHILIDSFTSYGTGWFEPFSDYRVSFNTIFVADVFYTIPFLICVIIALIAKNGSPKRIKWNKTGLIISSAYMLFTFINKIYVQDIMNTSFKNQNLKADEFITTPTPLNNFLWMAYTKDSMGAYIGYYSIFDKEKNIKYNRYQKNDSLLKSYENNKEVEILKQFSQGHYLVWNDSIDTYFYDIRFGQLGGWDNSDAGFPFAFKLNKQGENSAALNRTKFKGSFSDAFSSLVKRVRGI